MDRGMNFENPANEDDLILASPDWNHAASKKLVNATLEVYSKDIMIPPHLMVPYNDTMKCPFSYLDTVEEEYSIEMVK